MEVLWSWSKPVYVWEAPYHAFFHRRRGAVKLVLTCFCAENILKRRSKGGGGAGKRVQACFSARKMEIAVFSTVEVLWRWCKSVYVWDAPYNAVFTAEEGLWSTWRPVEVPIKMEKQFSPLKKSSAAGANLFLCGKHGKTPPWRCCEEHAGLFKCQKCWRKQFSQLWKSCEAGESLFMCGKHRFHRRGGAVKHVQTCLSARKDGQISFLHCGRLLRNTPYNAVFTAEVVLWIACSPV